MNELDFDKLLSIEDPAPAKKPKLEPVLPVPPAPEPEEKPEEQLPRLRPRHIVAAIVLVALLIVGIGLGRWLKNIPITDNALPPARPITTVPPPSIPPSATIPAYTETRNSILLQENGHFSCHAYTERIDTSIRISFSGNEAENAIWDGTTLHIPQPVTSSFAPQYNIYNVWLRIELTENGKDFFRGSTPALDTVVKDRQIIPYCLPGSDEVAGWFILARVYQTCTATLTFDGLDLALPVTLNPVYDSLNLHYITTEELVATILADGKLWEEELPYPFSRNVLLNELLRRTNNIEILLQLLDKGAATYDADIATKAAQLLEQKELYSKLTDEQRIQFLRLTGQYFDTHTYSYALDITSYPNAGATVFEDKNDYWVVAPEVPAELAGLPSEKMNFFIRVSLLDHTRERYGDGLTLTAKPADPNHTVGIREYYDEEGLAGWFIYGRIYDVAEIPVTLTPLSQEHLQTETVSAEPLLYFDVLTDN